MSIREDRCMRAVEDTLNYALLRLEQLDGHDRLAFAYEYKEWLTDSEVLTEKVWFSGEIKN